MNKLLPVLAAGLALAACATSEYGPPPGVSWRDPSFNQYMDANGHYKDPDKPTNNTVGNPYAGMTETQIAEMQQKNKQSDSYNERVRAAQAIIAECRYEAQVSSEVSDRNPFMAAANFGNHYKLCLQAKEAAWLASHSNS